MCYGRCGSGVQFRNLEIEGGEVKLMFNYF